MDQVEEQLASQRALSQCQPVVDGGGRSRDTTSDPTDLRVGADGEEATPCTVPGGVQRVRQQRQVAGVVCPLPATRCHLEQEQLHEPVLDVELRLPGEFDDCLAQLGLGHRPERELVSLRRVHPTWIPQYLSVKVRAQPEHNHGPARIGRRVQCRDEPLPLPLVGARGEQLLELVHYEHRLVGRHEARTGGGVGV